MIPAPEIIHTSAFSRGVITCVSFPCSISHLTPDVLTIPLLFPSRSSPPHFTLPSTACVLKRFPLTSPRKLALTCVKRGFLRTAEPHRTSQLSPCAPLCRSAMFMLCLAVMWHAPHLRPAAMHLHCTIGSSRARNLVLPCFPTPQFPPFAIPHLTPDTLSILTLLAFLHSPYSFSITLSTHFPSLCRLHTGPIQF